MTIDWETERKGKNKQEQTTPLVLINEMSGVKM